jgi:hypothetical protein
VPRDKLGGGRNVEALAGGGGQNGGKLRVTGGLSGEKGAVIASAAGFLAEGAPYTELDQGTVKGLDAERALGASLRANVGDFTLVGKINQRRKQAPTAPLGSAFGVPGTEYTDARGFAELRFEHAWERVQLNARASYDGSRYRGYYAHLDDQGVKYRTTDSGGGDWFGAELRAGIALFGQNRLTASVEGNVQLVTQQQEGAGPDPHTRIVLSGTLLDEWQVHPRVFLQAGVRLDKYNDLPDFALSPRGAIVMRLYDAGVTKLVAGQAFRAPTIYEVYFNDANLTQRAPTVPLRPELITTFELEHSHDLTPELRATVGGYFNLIDRLVVTAQDTAMPVACGTATEPVACLVYGNSAGRVMAGGAEAQLRWQPGRYMLFEATYSFVTLQGTTAGETYAYPTHLASLRALVPLKQGLVRLSGQGTYQSARRGPDGISAGEAVLLNFGLSGEYGPVRYFAGVQNLLDQRYALPVASEVGSGRVPQYGRTFFVELAGGF